MKVKITYYNGQFEVYIETKSGTSRIDMPTGVAASVASHLFTGARDVERGKGFAPVELEFKDGSNG